MPSTELNILLFLVAIVPGLSQWQGRQTECGLQPEMSSIQIVGGEKADKHEWPWQAALYRNGRRICGASVIDEMWIITAAHCVDIILEPEIFEFKVGSNSLANDTVGITQRRRATELYVHPDFSPSTLDNDIALFKMEKKFDLWTTYAVNTVCLPTKAMDAEFAVGENATVTGWGALQEGGSTPDELYEVVVPIYDQNECNQDYEGAITDNMICAGVPEGGVDSCQGDSGGPMVAFSDGNEEQYYLIGIVSWGRGCARPDYPGVYTRVTQYEEWIRPIFTENERPVGKTPNCTKDEFQCRGGDCIPEEYRCQGSNQCYYGTDEEFCDGLLKTFNVYYYSQITPSDVMMTDTVTSREECANMCLMSTNPCYAFDVTPLGDGSYRCDLAGMGFTVQEIPNSDRTFNHFVVELEEPGFEFVQGAGVIASPYYIDGYFPGPVNGEIYTWTITINTSNTDSLMFTILDVMGDSNCEDMENGFALLSITGKNSVEKTSYCLNSDLEGVQLSLPTTHATVELLTSDGSAYGFLMEYKSYYDCNKMYTVSPGVVTSPNYPSNYPNGIECATHIQAPEGSVVYFTIDDMSIESHPSCFYDSVTIYNGSTTDANTLGRGPYCGSNAPKTLFQSGDQDMLIVFESDGSVTDKGFSGSYYFGKATFGVTEDPKLLQIESLEDELRGYKFGIAGACIAAALLIIVLSASFYTVDKRDAKNREKLRDLTSVENGNENDSITPGTDAYKHLKEDETDSSNAGGNGEVNQAFEEDVKDEASGENETYEQVENESDNREKDEIVDVKHDDAVDGAVQGSPADSNSMVVVADVENDADAGGEGEEKEAAKGADLPKPPEEWCW